MLGDLVPDSLWERVEPLLPPRPPRRHRHPGRRPVDDRAALAGIVFVLHASSSGLVLLAHSDPAFQGQVLAAPHEAYTQATPTDAEQLRQILATIRRNGSAYCPGYRNADAAGIAAPVFRRGQVVAALSVVVSNTPTARQYEPLLRIAAATLTRRLQGAG